MGKPWKVWFEFAETSFFQEAATKYAKALFRRTYSIIPTAERNNPEKFYKQAKTVGIAEQSLGSNTEFNSLFQKAYSDYEQAYQPVN